MAQPYEVLLDVAALALRAARDARDAPDYHQSTLERMLGDLDGMYGAVVANKAAAKERLDEAIPSITCPKCGMTSYNTNDIAAGYCGNCHDWTQPRGADSHS